MFIHPMSSLLPAGELAVLSNHAYAPGRLSTAAPIQEVLAVLAPSQWLRHPALRFADRSQPPEAEERYTMIAI